MKNFFRNQPITQKGEEGFGKQIHKSTFIKGVESFYQGVTGCHAGLRKGSGVKTNSEIPTDKASCRKDSPRMRVKKEKENPWHQDHIGFLLSSDAARNVHKRGGGEGGGRGGGLSGVVTKGKKRESVFWRAERRRSDQRRGAYSMNGRQKGRIERQKERRRRERRGNMGVYLRKK